MPWLGNPFSLDKLLGLQLFNSIYVDPGLGSLKTAAAGATTNSLEHRKNCPAFIYDGSCSGLPDCHNIPPATSSFSNVFIYRNTQSQSQSQSRKRKLQETVYITDWPMAQLPVEIFELITSHLTRAEVKTLRLVSREFEAKVSGQYFRNVVVPFRSELYTSLGHDENGVIKPSTTNLFSNGMRIFESFGPHILRFALSLELDEATLAYPPVKPVQEAVPAFWGIYRWPHKTYHRYSDLEGLEQTADETEGMKKALQCLTKVSNLGLCCDAGLGFLGGPDQISRPTAARYPVFDTQDWRQDHHASNKNNPIVTVADFNNVTRDTGTTSFPHPDKFKRKVLEKMVSDAGFTEPQVDEAIRLLLESERTTLAHIDFDERSITTGNNRERQTSLNFINNVMELDLEEEVENETELPREVSRLALIPANLTRAQKELLLELEWAHRAMIQSFVIGVIDNAAGGSFSNLTTFTIAKIPSAHVHILCRDELWKSIPSVKNVTLGVIADWRKISKSAPGCVEDTPVSPVDAVGKVYRLLNDYIGRQPNIESIRFAWICGGEFATGPFQRNQYVMPAPFFQSPELMTLPTSAITKTDEILRLPHIKHLSLKNCWVSPHVLMQTIRQMALVSLEKLEFESVSLSGPPTVMPQLSLQTQALFANFMGMVNNGANPMTLIPAALGGQVPGLVFPTAPVLPAVGWTPPEPFSWPGVIEHFSPGVKVSRLMAIQWESRNISTPTWSNNLGIERMFLPDAGSLPSDENRYNLKCITFKSCGYVCLDVPHIDTRVVLPENQGNPSNYASIHRQDVSGTMQHSRDKLLGRVVPYLPPQELAFIENAFEMDIGWDKIYDEQMIDDAIADGIDVPGTGRFSGIIQSNNAWIDPNKDEDADTSGHITD